MRYSKWLKLGAVGAALLLIPRRSSRVASDNPNRQTDYPNGNNHQKDSKHADTHSKDSTSDNSGSDTTS